MPLEGHYERQMTPMYKLSPRETKTAWSVLAITLTAMLAVILLTVGNSSPPTPRGCIKASVAGVVGAETISGCGAEARAKCAQAARFDGERSETVLAECRAQGVPLTGDANDRSLTFRKG